MERQQPLPGGDAALLDTVRILTHYGKVTPRQLEIRVQEVDPRLPGVRTELAKRVEDVIPHTAWAKAYAFVQSPLRGVNDHAPGARGLERAGEDLGALQVCCRHEQGHFVPLCKHFDLRQETFRDAE